MPKIIKTQTLAPDIKCFILDAENIAKKAAPGQFVILRIDEAGERIPLTIADFSAKDGTITIVFQEVGYTTRKLGTLKKGGEILDLAGPLGHPSELSKIGTVVMVAGGIGIAPVYPIARALKAIGNNVISIIGARSKDLLFWEKEMKSASSELIVTTDDGSYAQKGFVTDALKEIIGRKKPVAKIIAIGPVPMMKAVARLTEPYKIKTVVSLNPIMVDGTGMCGGCRVLVSGNKKFCCVDGPEFDAHEVDFDGLAKRLKTYAEEENFKDVGSGGELFGRTNVL